MGKHVIIAGLLGACILGGCTQADLGMERSMGQVKYADAFNAARSVMGQYFTISSTDEAEGVIRAQSNATEAGKGVLTSYPQRRIATVTLLRQGDEALAYARVELQRLGVAEKTQPGKTSAYGGPPNQTPAELEAATTTEQNEYWVTLGRDQTLEMRLLADIYRALHAE